MLRPPVDATADEPVMVVRRRIQGVLDSIDRTLSDAAPRPSTEDPLHAQRATAGATAIPPELPARPPTTASKPLRGGDSPGTSFGEWSELTDPSPVRPLYMDRHNHAIPTMDEGVKLPTQPLPPASVGEAVLPPRPAPMTAAAAAPHPRSSPTYTPADVGDGASRRWQRAEIVSTAAPREATPTREAPRRPPTSQQRLLSPQRSAPSPLRRPSNSPPSFLDADENNTDLLFPRRAPREVSDEVMQSPPRTTPYSSTMAKLIDDPRFGYNNNNNNNNYINAPRVPRGVGTTATLRTPSMDPMEERISFVEEAEQRLEAQRAAAEKLAQQRRAHTATAQRAQQQQHALLRARAAGDSRERFAALLGHAERVQQEAQEWLSEGGVVPAEVMAVRHHARELDRARSLFEYVKRAVAMTELPAPSPLPRLEMLRPAPAPHTAAEYPKFQPKNFTNDALVVDDDDDDDDAIMLTPPRSRRVSSVMNAPTAGLLAECINSEGGSTPGRMPPPSPGAEADLADAANVMNDDDDLDVDGSASYSESESEQETEPYRGAPHRGGSSASASASSPRSPSSTRQHTRFAIPVPSQGRQASPSSSKPAAPTTPPSNTEAALTPSSTPTAATSRVGETPSAPRTTSPAKTVAPPKAAPAVAASPSPTTPRFKAPAGVPPSAMNTPASTPTQSPNKQPQTTPQRTPRDDIRNAVARAYRQTAQRLLQAGLPLKVRLASGAAVPAHLRWIPAQHELCFTTVRMMSGNTNNNNNNNNKKDGMKSSAPGAASPLRSTSPSSMNRSHRPSAISPTRSGSPAHAQPPILHTRTNTGISSAQSAPPTPPLRQVSFNCADHRTYSILLPTNIAANNNSNNNNNPPQPTSSPQRSQSPATSQRSAVPPSASPAKKMVPPSAVHGKKMIVPPTSSPAKKMVASASPPTSSMAKTMPPTSSVAKTMPPNPSPSKKMIMAPPTASPPAKMMAPPGTTPVKKMMMAAPTSAPASSTRAVASPPRAASPSSSPPTAAPSTIREDHRVLWDRDVGHGKLLLPTSFFTPAISSSRNKKRSPSSGRTSTAEWGGRAACQALRRCGCRMFAEMPPISAAPMYRLYVLVARQALRAPCVVPAPTTTTTTTPADTRPPATNSSTQDSLLAHWPLAHRLSTGEAVIVVELNSRVDYILCSIALSARSGRAATYGEMLWRIAAQRLREAHARSGTRNSQQR